MREKAYPVSIELEAPLGMFPDPFSGNDPVSQILPSVVGVRAICEQILLIKDKRWGALISIRPIAAVLCSEPSYYSYASNSNTVARSKSLIENGNAMQIKATALRNPCFRLFALAQNTPASLNEPVNHAHAYSDRFYRKLRAGKNYRHPYMGRREHQATYFGEFRPEKTVFPYTTTVPLTLTESINYADPTQSPTWIRRNIEKGWLFYEEQGWKSLEIFRRYRPKDLELCGIAVDKEF